MFAWGPITVEGRVPQPGEKFINADVRMVSGHYFQAMEIPLREGRLFNENDVAGKPRVAIVDDNMAQQLWPNRDPIGKRLHIGGINETNSPWITVVGVAGRVKQYTLDSDSRIAFYLPQTQYVTRAMNVVMRSSSDPVALAGAVKQQVRELNSDLPLYNVSTMQERFNLSLARRRFAMIVLGTFAAISLALAAIGIYGLIAYLTGQGTREVGIRLALGATPANIVSLIVSGRHDPHPLGRRPRHRRRPGRQPPHAISALWCPGHRYRDLCRRSRPSRRHRASRQLHPRPARFPPRSQHVVALRIEKLLPDIKVLGIWRRLDGGKPEPR